MIVTVNGQRVRIDAETQEFIESLSDQTGTPAAEIVGAIISGHMGGI
jgi:predicted DNA-binding protein